MCATAHCAIIHKQKQNKMKKKFVIQCATTKKYFVGFSKFCDWDDFLAPVFFDSEKKAEEFIENNMFGDFNGKYIIILKVLTPF